MAQAALRIVEDEIDTRIVRRLMARPLRVVAEPVPTLAETDIVPPTRAVPEIEPILEIAPVLEAPVADVDDATLDVVAPPAATVPDGRAAEMSRLQTEVMVMKAVLGAERRETERLRACITGMDEAQPLTPEARAVRDRWAALVDTLIQAPR